MGTTKAMTFERIRSHVPGLAFAGLVFHADFVPPIPYDLTAHSWLRAHWKRVSDHSRGLLIAILGAGILLAALTSNVARVFESAVRLVGGQPFLPEKAAGSTGAELPGVTAVGCPLLPAYTEGVRRPHNGKPNKEQSVRF